MGLAFLTCWVAGIAFGTDRPDVASMTALPTSAELLTALWYPVGVMSILFAHEMGHYVQTRLHGVEASPPYFIPGLPIPGVGVFPFIGTLGAFIRLEWRPMPSKAILEIGAWGPLAGWIIAIPVLMAGMAMSEIRPLPVDAELITLGDSLLLLAGEALFHPNIPVGHDVFLHPLAMAGWTGCLLTALNLLPLGQLDGGHVCYAVFGERFNRVAPILFVCLCGLGIFAFAGWLIFAALVWTLGVRHPAMATDDVVRGRQAWLAPACVVMFATTFALAPIEGMSVLDLVMGR
jgi:membrane-associated protease RseP (regulator of RpoE activity)